MVDTSMGQEAHDGVALDPTIVEQSSPDDSCGDGDSMTVSEPTEESPPSSTSSPPSSTSSTKTRVWMTPWAIMMVALYVFILPWINVSIVQRYFLKQHWQAALPGLDRTIWHKVTMQSHMACGAICVLLGPLQLLPFVRRRLPTLHRWSGRIYCVCAMASTVFGLIFIYLKGQLVGGWNMTAAFSMAGTTIGVLGFKVWQSARAAKAGAAVDFTPHRNWGIRSYSQILAPILYRYWYICLAIFDWYQGPKPLRMGGKCREDDICPEYLRWFDKVHCWTYWLTSLAVAELIIRYLPPHTISTNSGHFLAESGGHEHLIDIDTTEESVDAATPLLEPVTGGNYGPPPRTISSSSPVAVNVIGWALAAITITITTKLCFYKGP